MPEGENIGGGDNQPSPVGIGLTDLPNIEGASGPPGPPGSGITAIPSTSLPCNFKIEIFGSVLSIYTEILEQ